MVIESGGRTLAWAAVAAGLGAGATLAQDLRPYQPPTSSHASPPAPLLRQAPRPSLEEQFRRDLAQRKLGRPQLQSLADEFDAYRTQAIAERRYEQARQYDGFLEILRTERGVSPTGRRPR